MGEQAMTPFKRGSLQRGKSRVQEAHFSQNLSLYQASVQRYPLGSHLDFSRRVVVNHPSGLNKIRKVGEIESLMARPSVPVVGWIG